MRKILFVFISFVTACSLSERAVQEPTKTNQQATKIELSSAAFANGQSIPKKYTCDGEDISPPLKWMNAPKETKSFALISDDPDAPAGTWVHWVIFNIPADVSELKENLPKTESVLGKAKQGINDFEKIGYGGPCPPSGKPHRYFFKLYALDTELNLSGKVKKEDLVKAMQGHILAEGQIMGTYQRAQ